MKEHDKEDKSRRKKNIRIQGKDIRKERKTLEFKN